MTNADVIQSPASPTRLILLFHGIGQSAANMISLGQAISERFPRTYIVSIQAPFSREKGGWQWYAAGKIDDETRQKRVEEAMPHFCEAIAQWQAKTGFSANETVLIGYSQGAIMALEALKLRPAPSQSILSLAGKFASLPAIRLDGSSVHMIQGEYDRFNASSLAVSTKERLAELGAKTSLDILPNAGHELEGRFVSGALSCLSYMLRKNNDSVT